MTDFQRIAMLADRAAQVKCVVPSDWTPDRIQRLRHALGESVTTFAARFARSGRTVEAWEAGIRRPDAFVVRELDRLDQTRPRTPGQ